MEGRRVRRDEGWRGVLAARTCTVRPRKIMLWAERQGGRLNCLIIRPCLSEEMHVSLWFSNIDKSEQ